MDFSYNGKFPSIILLEISTNPNLTHLYINRVGDANRELLILVLYLMTTFSCIDYIDQSDKTYSIMADRRTGTDMESVDKISSRNLRTKY